MSNFICNHCGAEIIDGHRGYVTGCEHYPLAKKTVLDIPYFLRNQKSLIDEIAELRARNASDHEIAIAVGIPEDSPLLIK